MENDAPLDSRTTRHRAVKVRLYPTHEQAQKMGQFVGACRFVYNLALEQRRDWYRPGRKFNATSQCKELTALRAEVDWLRDVPAQCLQQAIRDLEQAYVNWWAGRAARPSPRRLGLNDSFRVPQEAAFKVQVQTPRLGSIRLPKLGFVEFRGFRDIGGAPKNVTVSRRAGQWFASIIYEQTVVAPANSKLAVVGIDLGVASFATLSDGSQINSVNCGRRALQSLRRAQRALARKKRGSANRRKAVARIARIQMRVANARKDFLHKQSTIVAKNHGTVVVEKLQLRNMTASAAGTIESPGNRVRQKSGLNRAILDQGWGMFRTMLAYKLAERGGRLVEVPAAFTSQTCQECGHVAAENRQKRRFACVSCGHQDDADANAAVNILRRAGSASKPVEGHRARRPVEAGTIRLAA